MAIEPDSILGQAIDIVTDQMKELDSISREYRRELSDSLRAIGDIKVDEVPAPDRPAVPEPAELNIDLADMPEFDPPALNIPSMPDGVDIDSLLDDLDIGDLDPLPSAPAAPVLNIPDAPGMANIQAPQRPAIDTQVEIPEAPAIALPEMEQLIQVTLPTFEFPQLPTFDDVPPDASGIVVPNVFINWTEPAYQSEVLDEIQAKVREMMAGASGLPPAVEEALFSRARERDSAETKRAVQEAVDTWASRDFSMPPGMLVKAADVAREQGRLRAAETNRDILIEAARWEIEGVRFAVERGIALEQITSNLYENMAGRLFEAAKFHAEAQIRVFDAQIALFNAQNAAFQTKAEVYRTRLEAAISKLTAYKTAVEGQVALGQINQQRVEVFKAKLDAVQSNVEIYKAMVQGAQVRAETIKNQFDAYRADVQAYAEQIGAEKAKFDAYESRIKGEQAKAGIFDAQTRAFAETVRGVATKADVKVKAAQVKSEAARAKVAKFLAEVDAFKAELEASLGEVRYATTVYQAKAEGWRAQSSAKVAEAEVHSRYADMNSRTNIAFAEMQIAEYQASIQKAVQEAQIALEAAKALGQYTAQLAAGAMSAAHVSASVSGSGSANTSDSRSTSNSTSHNYNY